MATPFMFLLMLVGLLLAVVCVVLLIGFVVVPLFRGVGNGISASFRGLAFMIRHVVGWFVGTLSDLVRLVGATFAAIVLVPFMLVCVLVGRWSAASHYAASVVAETRIGGLCLYRALLRRPLRLFFLDGLVEGLEQRIPLAIENAPVTDAPRRGVPGFDGYTIVGSIRAGGSGAKLHVAEPQERLRLRRPDLPEQVVIKSFAISEGSALPQIVRESRALDAARQLGLVLDHGIDANRFFYVMPYHPGDNLGVVTRRLHGGALDSGLGLGELRQATSLVSDLVETLVTYHAGGLWHKDIKPDNIMVHDGKAHVVDLGLVTPLRSAMTLTTHGTEYFRDPEMVRMALRGVKVHQVDGAKFDIYAAGAVLYFMLENTFPAHGGLSSFAKRSPEALRWIVRRAMADYAKRYERAALMLADIRFVLDSSDPYGVRPAELPSMRDGQGASTMPPPPEWPGARPTVGPTVAAPIGIGAAAAWPAAARVKTPFADGMSGGAAGVGVKPVGLSGSAEGPTLRVTNWWSGTYESASGPMRMPRGLSAREQREMVRRRADAARTRAMAAIRRPRDPSTALIVLTSLAIAAIIGGAMIAAAFLLPMGASKRVGVTGDRTSASKVSVTVPPRAAARESVLAIDGLTLVRTDGSRITDGKETFIRTPRRVVLINSHPTPSAPDVIDRVDKAIAALAANDIEVIIDDTGAAARVTSIFLPWIQDPASRRDDLDGVLAATGFGGVLSIYAGPSEARQGFTRSALAEVVIASEAPPVDQPAQSEESVAANEHDEHDERDGARPQEESDETTDAALDGDEVAAGRLWTFRCEAAILAA